MKLLGMAISTPYLRQLLALKYDWIETTLHEYAKQNGYSHLTPALTRLFGHIRKKPVSISDLARKMMISRQAVHKLLIEAKDMGYIELIDDAQDKRIKLVKFTSAGLEMAKTAIGDLEKIETKLIDVLGPEDFQHLKRILSKDWNSECNITKI